MVIRDERGRPLVAELETWLSGAARQALLQEDRQGYGDIGLRAIPRARLKTSKRSHVGSNRVSRIRKLAARDSRRKFFQRRQKSRKSRDGDSALRAVENAIARGALASANDIGDQKGFPMGLVVPYKPLTAATAV